MTHKFTTKSWRDLLPVSYEWASKVPLSSTKEISKTSSFVVLPVSVDTKSSKVSYEGSIDGLSDIVKKAVELQAWTGEGSLFHTESSCVYLLVPLIKSKADSKLVARAWGQNIAKNLKSRHLDECSIEVSKDYESGLVLEGIFSGFFDYSGFISNSKNKVSDLPKKISLTSKNPSNVDSLEYHRNVSTAVYFARFLQDAPANWMDAEQLAQTASEASKDWGISAKVLDDKDLEKENMNLFLSVARGSKVGARMVIMHIKGKDSSKSVALVGKGLTFDAGGISLKPSNNMWDMKYDMSGAAAVVGAMHLLAKEQPPVDVYGVIGCAENMPSSHATKPGDLIKARNGKTVEVLNTDAEGRLVLADTLNYVATELKPDLMLNAATLTGACLHALGHNGGAIVSTSDEIADKVKASSKKAGESFWQLPLWPEISKELKTECGDLRNIAKAGVAAGTIVGGAFLSEFIEDRAWAHLDIAGVAWNCKSTGHPSSGGSGYAVRTMAQVCMDF